MFNFRKIMYLIGKIEFLASPSKDKTALTITLDDGSMEDFTVYNPIVPQTLKNMHLNSQEYFCRRVLINKTVFTVVRKIVSILYSTEKGEV